MWSQWCADGLLKKCEELRLLEEIDAQSFALRTEQVEQSSSSVWIMAPPALLAGFTALYRPRIALSIASATCASLCLPQLLYRNRLLALASSLHQLLRSSRHSFKFIKEREAIAFSLRIPQNLSVLRARVLVQLRAAIKAITDFTRSLIRTLDDEERHLVENFYTDEMRTLLTCEVDASVTNDFSLKACQDLLLLHVSELCRLLLIYVSRLSLWNLADSIVAVIRLQRSLSSIANTISAVSSLQVSSETRKEHREKIGTLQKLDKVAFALDDIVQGIFDRSLSEADVQRALHAVIHLNGLSLITTTSDETSVGQPTTASDDDVDVASEHYEIRMVPPMPPPPPSDQMFEAIVTREDVQSGKACNSVYFTSAAEDASLMSELRVALQPRAADFQARERRALAAFYGVDDVDYGEIVEREEKEEVATEAPTPQLPVVLPAGDETYSGEGENTKGEMDMMPMKREFRPLASDILFALGQRRAMMKEEEVLGDD